MFETGEKQDIIKHNTVIFVQNSLFVSGIKTILESNKINVKVLNIEELYNFEPMDSIYICQINDQDMQVEVIKLLEENYQIKLILIKNSFDFIEIESFIEMGVKGLCLTDVDEEYLVNTVKQVHNGNMVLDHRFTRDLIQEFKRLKLVSQHVVPIDPAPLYNLLTNRELEVFELITKGYTNLQISYKLIISEKTVKNHVSNLLDKLEVQDRLNAVIKAVKNNWIRIG
jgi:two-component system response regulator DegU